jgi:hypothetical protein
MLVESLRDQRRPEINAEAEMIKLMILDPQTLMNPLF